MSLFQASSVEMASPSVSPIGSTNSSVSSIPSSPRVRPAPEQLQQVVQNQSPPHLSGGDVHEILKRYFYDLNVQRYLRQLEMARLQPPEWTQKQQFSTMASSSGASGERKRYSVSQTKMLRGAYRRSKYISRQDMVRLAEECGLTAMQVGPFI